MKNVVLLVLLITLCFSCSELNPSGNEFKIISLESRGETYKYNISSLEGSAMFYYETKRVYKVGDTLTLELKK